MFEPCRENGSYRFAYRLHLATRKLPDLSSGMDSGPEEHLVCINVAKTGNKALIEQRSLDRHDTATECLGELRRRGEVDKGVASNPLKPGIGQLVRGENGYKTKRARVDEADLLLPVGDGNEVGVVGFGIARC